VALNFSGNINNLTLLNAGLGESSNKKKILTHDQDGTSMGGTSRFVNNIDDFSDERTEAVTIMSLDTVITEKDKVSIIQLDVEGYEEQALKGAMEIITTSKPILILECWHPTMFDSDFFQNEIMPLGYTRGPNLHDNAVLKI
jgi:FkbM family methyltransferase